MSKPSWDASELARSALSELTERERADLMTAEFGKISNLHALCEARNALTERVSDIIAERYAALGAVSQKGLFHEAETAKPSERQSIPKAYAQHRAELLRQFDAGEGRFHVSRSLPRWIEPLLRAGGEDA